MASLLEGYSTHHELLEPPSINYSNLTVQRAFIVWTKLGYTNTFTDVCGYYHRLEKMEETLTKEQRAQSRKLEFDLLNEPPPSSLFLLRHFPNLYPRTQQHNQTPDLVKQMTKQRLSSNRAYVQLKPQENQVTLTEDIVAASQLIRNYCHTHQVTLRQFIIEFKEYANKCSINPTLSNVAFYIKYRSVLEQREIEANYNNLESKYISIPTSSEAMVMDSLLKYQNEMEYKLDEIKNKFSEPLGLDVGAIVHNVLLQQENASSDLDSEIDDVLNEISEIIVSFNEEVSPGAKRSDTPMLNQTKKDIQINGDNLIRKEQQVDINANITQDLGETTALKPKQNKMNKPVCSIKVMPLKCKLAKTVKKNGFKKKSQSSRASSIESISFKSSNESINLIDFSQSPVNLSILSDDFDFINENRCSTSVH